MKLYEYDVAGNKLLLLASENRPIDLVSGTNLAKLCWLDNTRVYDGVAVFTVCPQGFWSGQFKFFNPDGSEELVCGNALLAISRDFLEKDATSPLSNEASVVARFDGRASSLAITVPTSQLEGDNTLFETGTPHRVLKVANVASYPLDDIALTGPKNENLTVLEYLSEDPETRLAARTLERGVNSETMACGTGAAAAALHCFTTFGTKVMEISFPGGQYLAAISYDNDSSVTVCISLTKEQIKSKLAKIPLDAIYMSFWK